MKKFLTIVLLGLLLSDNAYAGSESAVLGAVIGLVVAIGIALVMSPFSILAEKVSEKNTKGGNISAVIIIIVGLFVLFSIPSCFG